MIHVGTNRIRPPPQTNIVDESHSSSNKHCGRIAFVLKQTLWTNRIRPQTNIVDEGDSSLPQKMSDNNQFSVPKVGQLVVCAK